MILAPSSFYCTVLMRLIHLFFSFLVARRRLQWDRARVKELHGYVSIRPVLHETIDLHTWGAGCSP